MVWVLLGLVAGFVVVTVATGDDEVDRNPPSAPEWSRREFAGWSLEAPALAAGESGPIVAADAGLPARLWVGDLDGVRVELLTVDIGEPPEDQASTVHSVADGFVVSRRYAMVDFEPTASPLGAAGTFRCRAAGIATCAGHVVVAGSSGLVIAATSADPAAPAAAFLFRLVASVRR